MPFIEEAQGQIYLRNVSPAPVSLHITSQSRLTSLRSTLMGPSAIANPIGMSETNAQAAAGRDDAPLLFDTNEEGDNITIRPGETMAFNGGDMLSRGDIAGIRRLIDAGVLEIVDPLTISGDDPLAYGARTSRPPDGFQPDMAAFARLQDRTWWKTHYGELAAAGALDWMTDEQRQDAAHHGRDFPPVPPKCPHCGEVIREAIEGWSLMARPIPDNEFVVMDEEESGVVSVRMPVLRPPRQPSQPTPSRPPTNEVRRETTQRPPDPFPTVNGRKIPFKKSPPSIPLVEMEGMLREALMTSVVTDDDFDENGVRVHHKVSGIGGNRPPKQAEGIEEAWRQFQDGSAAARQDHPIRRAFRPPTFYSGPYHNVGSVPLEDARRMIVDGAAADIHDVIPPHLDPKVFAGRITEKLDQGDPPGRCSGGYDDIPDHADITPPRFPTIPNPTGEKPRPKVSREAVAEIASEVITQVLSKFDVE